MNGNYKYSLAELFLYPEGTGLGLCWPEGNMRIYGGSRVKLCNKQGYEIPRVFDILPMGSGHFAKIRGFEGFWCFWGAFAMS